MAESATVEAAMIGNRKTPDQKMGRLISRVLKERAIGGIFSAALSVATPSPVWPPDVIWHSALWSPDFPPVACATSDCLADPGRSVAPAVVMSLAFAAPLLQQPIDVVALAAAPAGHQPHTTVHMLFLIRIKPILREP